MSVTEFAPGAETCVAVIHQGVSNGSEAYVGPITIGYYPGQDELWIDCEGQRINLPLRHLKNIQKQLKRAEQISNESSAP